MEAKRTLATTIRCDARQAAELVLFFNSCKVDIESMSDLLRRTVETLSTIAKNNNLTRDVLTTEEAVQILRENGVIDLTKERKNRNFKTLIEDLTQEDLRLDGSTPVSDEFQPTPEMLADLDRRTREQSDEKSVLASNTPNVVEEEDGHSTEVNEGN